MIHPSMMNTSVPTVAMEPIRGNRRVASKYMFPWKLFCALEKATHDEALSEIICWVPEGTALYVHKHSDDIFQRVMKDHFKSQTRYSSFTRQLYLYGFSKLSNGPHKGAFFHPNFVRYDPLCYTKVDRRLTSGKDRRYKKQESSLATGLPNLVSGKDNLFGLIPDISKSTSFLDASVPSTVGSSSSDHHVSGAADATTTIGNRSIDEELFTTTTTTTTTPSHDDGVNEEGKRSSFQFILSSAIEVASDRSDDSVASSPAMFFAKELEPLTNLDHVFHHASTGNLAELEPRTIEEMISSSKGSL